MEARALVGVSAGLAEDLDAEYAVVVVDRFGSLQTADRSAGAAGADLDEALRHARRALADDGAAPDAATAAGAALVRAAGSICGAIGISGSLPGLAVEACRSAPRAIGLVIGPGGLGATVGAGPLVNQCA
jgi:uncharacterized protein GlcG (DUF336 family)